ncbi:hypothetical protein Rrhod_1021 [Rhodococcus rhodnii LMG 5362]|uniref:IrrE N-terminal-like domain-containing protein n=1 Tax=Rhodococcus rhodnii LMG 5362 TaxID=1273125 RepID=R7WQL9_9NOCA|nr:hypothetical protein Rrhod_1021 [Rhodococcus rhodnii LMG 5362]
MSTAVDAVADVAAEAEAVEIADAVAAFAQARGRSIVIEWSPRLAGAVCGQRREYDDRDVIALAPGLPDPERTLAHELGHIVFGHRGVQARDALLEVSDDLIAYMLNERRLEAGDSADDEAAVDEWEAETFASLFLARVKTMRGRGHTVSVLRYDEALGR